MEVKELKIKSKCDGLQISVTIYSPEKEIKGIFQIAHGMSEHKERYYPLMRYLTERGYVTIINDHRGHGQSVKSKDDLGYFYDTTSEYIVEDLHQITMMVKELYPNQKLNLLGHSMGSMVVRKYMKKYDNEIDKLIVCGSPSENKLVNFGLIFLNIRKFLKGERYRSETIQKMALGNFNKKSNDNTSLNSWICEDKETVQQYDKDELCGFTFTINGFENLFKLMKSIYSKKGWQMKNKDLPILFIAGSEDPIIVNKKKWRKSQEFLKKLGYINVTNRMYEGLRHEILNEINKEEVYGDIINFIEK